MKNVFKLNLFFIGFPILLCLIGILDENFIFWGLLSTILTGIFQVIVGVGMLVDEPKDKQLQIYVAAVVAFFIMWLLTAQFGLNEFITYCLIGIPPCLALYLTFIIYKKRKL